MRIQIKDEQHKPLSGVLVSASGTNFRSNGFTQDDGVLVVNGLVPGQYFIRPALKEYSFSPSNQVAFF